jgi:tRNA 2-thiouridine synthesizing protein A
MIEKTLDTSGLNCPLPILKTKQALNNMKTNQKLKLIATDPGSVKDVEAFCTQTGNKLIENKYSENKYIFIIEKQ